jgi:CIC family chloride channel protein
VLIAAGAGSGIAATFNTPIVGIAFAVELILPFATPPTLLVVALGSPKLPPKNALTAIAFGAAT